MTRPIAADLVTRCRQRAILDHEPEWLIQQRCQALLMSQDLDWPKYPRVSRTLFFSSGYAQPISDPTAKSSHFRSAND